MMHVIRARHHLLAASALILAAFVGGPSVGGLQAQDAEHTVYEPALYEGLDYRMIGPSVGARSTAVEGIADQPFTFYMGTTGGGVWKTEDAGQTWEPITDAHFEVGSIGAIDAADSDPNVIYVGTGSAGPRGNVSVGRGVYKSTDGGESWSHIGLRDAGLIGRIVVHPENPDLVYLAALGQPFGTNEQRGVYRTEDGGESWERVLFVSDSTGAVDLSMNPDNPREIYAAMWRVERKPWTLISGSEDSGVFKTVDGGDSWEKLSGGLPDGLVGRIGVSVSPANPHRVWALVEAREEAGGLYRSDDRGRTWRQVNNEGMIRSRPFYYNHVIAHPTDEHTVYVASDDASVSTDGGRTFDDLPTPHTDNHDFWLNPNDPEIMVVANDGGAQVSVNAGETWSSYLNQPTNEIYRVFVDDQFPYRVYGPVQDFNTLSVPAWRSTGHIDAYERNQYWYGAGGGESGDIQIDPRDPDVTYAGSGSGRIERVDRSTGAVRPILTYPEATSGAAARDLRYRFQWNAPIRLSPHDPDVLYHTSQYVHRSTDNGQSWEIISPDLTRNDPEKQGYSGPITHDGSGVEIYNTIFAFEASPHSPGVLWAGSDDGLVHLSRDGGENWTDVTPDGLPAWSTVNVIELSAHAPGRAIVTAYRYRMNDYRPYVFLTNDYGESWERIADGTRGIPADYPVRVVREDPDRRGLLYAGTEFGAFISFDDGANWQPFQLDLPVTPVTDMKVHRKDLVLSTQGRSFWILDDISPLHEIDDEVASADAHLFGPRDAYRVDVRYPNAPGWFDRPPVGAIFHYYLAGEPEQSVRLDVLDAAGSVVRTFSSDSAVADIEPTLSTEPGMHRVTWEFRHAGIDATEDAGGWRSGPKAVPGTYRVRLTVDGASQTREFDLLRDPRRDDLERSDLVAQLELALAIQDTAASLYDGLRTLRTVRDQVDAAAERGEEAGHGDALRPLADTIDGELTAIERELIQTEEDGPLGRLAYPPKLDDQLGQLFGYVTGPDERPTDGAHERFADLNAGWSELRSTLAGVLETDVARFNEELERLGVPGVVVPVPGQTAVSDER